MFGAHFSRFPQCKCPLAKVQMQWKLPANWQKFSSVYAICLLTIVGLWLRLPGLNLGLWRDEASTYFDLLPTSWGEIVRRVAYSELNPPAFFLMMAQWKSWFGAGEVALKIPALICGLLTIPVVYLLGCELGSIEIGFVAATIATLDREAIYHAQEARPYTMAALLSCTTVLLYCKSLQPQHQRQALCGLVSCAALLLYVQYTGLLLVGSLVGISGYLAIGRQPQVTIKPLVLAFAAIFSLFLLWLPIFLQHLSIGSPWQNKLAWLLRWKLLLYNLTYPLPTYLRDVFKYPLMMAFALWLWRLFVVQSRTSWGIVANARMTILTLSIVLPTLIVSMLSYSGHYLFFVLPLNWVLYSVWLVKIWSFFIQRWRQWWQQFTLYAILGLLALNFLVAPSILYATSLGSLTKSGIRSFAAEIVATAQPRTLYLLNPDYLSPTLGYYTARRVRLQGFARWDRPEIFSPQGYSELWKSATTVAKTLGHLRNLASKYQQLALVCDPQIQNHRNTIYTNSRQLLTELQQTYPLLRQREYPGTMESVSVYWFDLTATLNHPT